jgi:uncharacterized protein YndB with AHSA1/START domain
MRYVREEDIHADPRTVWTLLTELERWPEWTASTEQVTRLDAGMLRVGSRARVRQPKGRPRVWTVTELDAERSFTWTATSTGMRLTGGHTITPITLGVHAGVSFEVAGPLAWLGSSIAGARIRHYVDLEAEGLKRSAERHAAGDG